MTNSLAEAWPEYLTVTWSYAESISTCENSLKLFLSRQYIAVIFSSRMTALMHLLNLMSPVICTMQTQFQGLLHVSSLRDLKKIYSGMILRISDGCFSSKCQRLPRFSGSANPVAVFSNVTDVCHCTPVLVFALLPVGWLVISSLLNTNASCTLLSQRE